MVGPGVPPSADRPYPGLGTLLGIGTLCGVCVAAGVFLGLLVDKGLRSSPLFTFAGLVCGIFCAALGSYRVIRRYLKG